MKEEVTYTKKKKKKKYPVGNRKNNGSTQRKENGRTLKEDMFIEEYLIHFNAAKAARNSGYNDGKEKEKGWKLLQLPHVRDELDRRIKLRYKELKIDQTDIVRYWQAVAYFDPSVLYDDKGDFVGLHNLPPEHKLMIKSVSRRWVKDNNFAGGSDYREVVEFELKDPEKALENLATHLGMLKQNINMHSTHDIDLTIKVEELKKLGTDRLLQLDRILSGSNN